MSIGHGCAGDENGYAVSGRVEKKAKGCVDANTRRSAGRVVRLWGEMIAPTLLWSVFASGFALAEPQIARCLCLPLGLFSH